MPIKNDVVLSKLRDELECLRLELESKEKLLNEQAQTLSHFKKYTGNLLLSLKSAFGSARCPKRS